MSSAGSDHFEAVQIGVSLSTWGMRLKAVAKVLLHFLHLYTIGYRDLAAAAEAEAAEPGKPPAGSSSITESRMSLYKIFACKRKPISIENMSPECFYDRVT